MNVVIDANAKEYCVSAGRSCAVFSFDYIFQTASDLSARLAQLNLTSSELVFLDERGTLQQYEQYLRLKEAVSGLNSDQVEKDPLWLDSSTKQEVKALFRSLDGTSRKIRLFYGDSSTGLDWACLREPLVGYLTGFVEDGLRTPALLKDLQDNDVSAFIEGNYIVRVVEVSSGEDLYKHPSYHLPLFKTNYDDSKVDPFELHIALSGDQYSLEESFESEEALSQALAFLKGDAHFL